MLFLVLDQKRTNFARICLLTVHLKLKYIKTHMIHNIFCSICAKHGKYSILKVLSPVILPKIKRFLKTSFVILAQISGLSIKSLDATQ